MKPNRLEAFSDGVMAIVITIMVLELKAPHDPTPTSLVHLWPTFFAYALSFVIIAIYWVNHHHLIQLVSRVDATILWANVNMLFWMSLIPWATVYLGDNHALPFPVALYGAVSAAGAISFYLLRASIAPSQSRIGVQKVEQKNGAQESYRSSHLCRSNRSGIHLHTTGANYDCVARIDVFPAGTRHRRI